MKSKAFSLYEKFIIGIAATVTLASLLMAWLTYNYYWLTLPFGLLFLYVTVTDIKFVFYLLLFSLPLSIEFSFSSSLGTDLPTEPLMIGLMLVFCAAWFNNRKIVSKEFLSHPLMFLLSLHLLWMCVATIYSFNHLVSVKVLLAKSWYIVVFVFLGSTALRELKDFRKAYWCILIPTIATVFYTLARHSQKGFSFADVNTMMEPFYRNHVAYAAFIAQMVPLTWLAITWYRKGSAARNVLILSLVIMLVAVYFSYTRTSWLSVIIILPCAYLIRHRLIGRALIASAIAVTSFVIYVGYNNNYLKFAPNYQSTTMHEDLGSHLTATVEGQDISSAERVFRWVAGFRMWEANPVVGYGPGNFYNFYKPYAVASFQTYVSRNTERSTVHNYFLLTLIEQGIIGLIIFFIFTAALFVYGQRIYHRLHDVRLRRLAMALTLTLAVIYVNTFLSDMIETDKVGTIYFLVAGLLINLDIESRKQKNEKLINSDSAGGVPHFLP